MRGRGWGRNGEAKLRFWGAWPGRGLLLEAELGIQAEICECVWGRGPGLGGRAQGCGYVWGGTRAQGARLPCPLPPAPASPAQAHRLSLRSAGAGPVRRRLPAD